MEGMCLQYVLSEAYAERTVHKFGVHGARQPEPPALDVVAICKGEGS